MMLSEFISKHKNRSVLTAVMLIISIVAVIFTANDYALYSTPIAKVTDIEEKLDSSVSALINSKEDYYTQRITAEIKNGAALLASKAKVKVVPIGINASFKPFTKVIYSYGTPIDVNSFKSDDPNWLNNASDHIMNEIIRLAK